MVADGHTRSSGRSLGKRLLSEPTTHFFLVGVLLFVAHRLIFGDPRTIAVSRGLEADLVRRFRDHAGREPTPADVATAIRDWKRDEVLYREALRDGLDRDDATIRKVLADKVRERLALEVPKREPSDAELERWLETRRSAYEAPKRYDFQWVTFVKGDAAANGELDEYRRSLQSGANPRASRPVLGRSFTAAELRETFGADLAERIPRLPFGQWERLENVDKLLLVRLKRIEGGLPNFQELRPRLRADWSLAARQEAIERAIDAIVESYRFEESR